MTFGCGRARFARAAVVVSLLAGNDITAAADARSASTKASTRTVTIEAVQFVPDTIAVRAGDTVLWVNKDPFPHTVTSKEGGFDSHEIAPGKSWRYQARKTGVFRYLCTLHTTMKATLRVE